MTNTRIHKGNYEEFFLLYVDDELTAADRTAVESFTAGHPDLREELELLLETRLTPEKQSFGNTDALMKPEPTGQRTTRTTAFRWLATAAAAVWLLSIGLTRFSESGGRQDTRPPVILSQQPSVTTSPDARNTDIPAEKKTHPKKQTSEKQPVAQSNVTMPELAKPPALTKAVPSVVPVSEIPVKVTEIALPVSEDVASQQNASALVSVKNYYATEAIFHLDSEDEAEEEQGRSRKGFRGLVRKAARIYQKVTEPEADNPIVRLPKVNIDL